MPNDASSTDFQSILALFMDQFLEEKHACGYAYHAPSHTWIGGEQAGLRGSRQRKGRKAALVVVAVEKRGRATGRARMAVIPDFKASTLLSFIKQNVAPGSTVYTDGLKSFAGL